MSEDTDAHLRDPKRSVWVCPPPVSRERRTSFQGVPESVPSQHGRVRTWFPNLRVRGPGSCGFPARVTGVRAVSFSRTNAYREQWTTQERHDLQSETMSKERRKKIEELFGARICDFYALQEKCACISECEHGRMHINAEYGVVELIPIPNSPYCEIVATGFLNPAMPLIRYNTHDLAIAGKGTCPCGRALPVVESIQGRFEDSLTRQIVDSVEVVEAFPIAAESRSHRKITVFCFSNSHSEIRNVPVSSCRA